MSFFKWPIIFMQGNKVDCQSKTKATVPSSEGDFYM